MLEPLNLGELAARYHAELPARIREYLHARGIPEPVIDRHLLGWNDWRITIPVPDRNGVITSFKLAKAPDDIGPSPKMLATPGARLELYGWEEVLSRPQAIVICEGEFDRLVLEAQGFKAVTSTAGARTFRPEWVDAFQEIPEVYVCFDRDEAGEAGARRVADLMPFVKVVELPEEVGEGGDVTDFFVRLGRSPDDFWRLLAEAKPLPPPAPVPVDELPKAPEADNQDSPTRRRIERLKAAFPIDVLIARYASLRQVGSHLMAHCPFHEDRNPSLAVYPKTGTFHCFGCGRHGDIITFIREIEHLSFLEALDRLEGLLPSHGGTATPTG